MKNIPAVQVGDTTSSTENLSHKQHVNTHVWNSGEYELTALLLFMVG